MSETVTVAQLNARVKTILNGSPAVRDLWVNGEISNLKKYPSGYYFTLKDPDSEIRAVMFSRCRQRIDFEPKENMKVSAFGSVDMYVQRGAYQFMVETMRPAGVGDLFLAYEALKRRLEAEGLFDPTRKRPLPRYPRRIGVVTSEKGAVIHDIITTSASRFPADIILAPALVQGDGAAASIVSGIRLLNRAGVDVLIVGRGGGSLEDLWAFNEEPVARAIAASEAPVVSAVGHETDFTIADFVADVRAPTPTGAAALILRDRAEIEAQLEADMARASRALSGTIGRMDARFRVLDARLSPDRALSDIGLRSMSVDDLSSRADRALTGRLSDMRHRFEVVDARLSPSSGLQRIAGLSERVDSLHLRAESGVLDRLRSDASAVQSLSARLEALNPLNVLSRGYGMVAGEDGRPLTSVDGIRVGSTVRIRMRDGTAKAEVKEKERNERLRREGFPDELRGEHHRPRGAGQEARGRRHRPGREPEHLRAGRRPEGPLQGHPGGRRAQDPQDNGDRRRRQGRGPGDRLTRSHRVTPFPADHSMVSL